MSPHRIETLSHSDSEGSPFLVDSASFDSESSQNVSTNRDNDENIRSNNEPIAIVGIGKPLFTYFTVD